VLLSSRGGWIEALNPDTLEMVTRVKTPRLPENGSATAVWVGQSFCLFLTDGQEETRQSVSDAGEFGPPMPLSFRISGRACPYSAIATGGTPILYTGFGFTSDGDFDAPGGFVAVEVLENARHQATCS
jgi:hypothetical protein